MVKRMTISHAHEHYWGDAYHPGANTEGRRGVRVANVATVQFGAVVTADPNGVADGATATGSHTPTGTLVSGGIATFDVARNVTVSSTGADGPTVTITGTDEYGHGVVEEITAASGAVASGLKAFLTVSGVSLSATAAGILVGTGDRLGLPFRLASLDYMVGMTVDGVPLATTSTVVAGYGATQVSGATTADVRGTFTPADVADGTRVFGALFVMNDQLDDSSKAYGVAQYTG